MKKQAINFSWPAGLSDFSTDKIQGNFSRGKLRVFYKGVTADHRYFSEAFANELVKSLPYTPVVSRFNAEDDDFEGHASEQNIYGIVDPCSEITFEELDGITWCVCDVVLYTERPDTTGEIAKKIVGHKQSLELDPRTVKYVVNYDEKKHFKNIEFTAGTFVGVSVLGNNQEPAFTGSEFFAVNKDFEKKMQILKDYCENKQDQTQNGGKTMDFKQFMQLSWGDVSAKVEEAICAEYGNDAYTCLVDMFNDNAIVRFYYYMDGSCKLMRVKYECTEEGVVTLTGINEVHITYEDVEPAVELTPATNAEIDMKQPSEADAGLITTQSETSVETEEDAPTFENEVAEENSEVEPVGEEVTEEIPTIEEAPIVENVVASEESNIEEDVTTGDFDVVDDPAHVSSVEIAPETTKVMVEDEQKTSETSSSTSFTESERAEFEALKREKKITLVKSYQENLSEEDFVKFMADAENADTDEKDLELEILKAYKKTQEEVKPMRAFAFAPIMNASENTSTPLDDFVRAKLGRK